MTLGSFNPETSYNFLIAGIIFSGLIGSVRMMISIHFFACSSSFIFSSGVIPPSALVLVRMILVIGCFKSALSSPGVAQGLDLCGFFWRGLLWEAFGEGFHIMLFFFLYGVDDFRDLSQAADATFRERFSCDGLCYLGFAFIFRISISRLWIIQRRLYSPFVRQATWILSQAADSSKILDPFFSNGNRV